MPATTNFDETAAAYEQVKVVIANLRNEYESVCKEIEATESELKAAPLAHLPIEDLKAGILDFVDASGMRYAEEHVRSAIREFAQNRMMGGSYNRDTADKPMRFCDLEQCISGQAAAGGWAQLLTPQKTLFNDQVLYYFIAQSVKHGLAAIMADMQPEEFGYNKIHPDKIGSDRVTRRATIARLTDQLGALQLKKEDLKSKLAALGYFVVPTLRK